jgi:hypothetical protein
MATVAESARAVNPRAKNPQGKTQAGRPAILSHQGSQPDGRRLGEKRRFSILKHRDAFERMAEIFVIEDYRVE